MRSIRVNELVKRELSEVLHTYYREQAVRITLSEVDVTPDLRQAHIYYSVLGGGQETTEAERFFANNHKELRRHLSKRIVLKYLPHLHFHADNAMARGYRVNELLDEIEAEDDQA